MEELMYDNTDKLSKNKNFLNNQNYIHWDMEKWKVIDYLFLLTNGSRLSLQRLKRVIVFSLVGIFFFKIYLFMLPLVSEWALIVLTALMFYWVSITILILDKNILLNKTKNILKSRDNYLWKKNPILSIEEYLIDSRWRPVLEQWQVELLILKNYFFSEKLFSKISVVKYRKEAHRIKYWKVKTEETDSGHKIIY